VGQLWYSIDGAVFVNWGATAKLDTAYTPRNIVQLRDRSDNWVIHVITDRDVWAFDAAGPSLYLTDLQFPPGPRQGLGSATWRGNLYVTVGMGVHQYTGSSIDPVGLDRDDGLPLPYRGYINKLCPEYNGLYAFVLGPQSGLRRPQPPGLHGIRLAHRMVAARQFRRRQRVVSRQNVMVSTAQSAYRLWWPTYDGIVTFNLPTDFANPLALTTDIVGDFAADNTSYYLETGWFDASMKGYTKIASHLTLSIGGSMTNSTITVKYRTTAAPPTPRSARSRRRGFRRWSSGRRYAGITPGVAFEKIEIRWKSSRVRA
jgi:hypothetical protein